MERRPLLLTVGTDQDYAGMVQDHKVRHLTYAAKWGYVFEIAPVPDKSHMFGRIELILERAKMGLFSHIFWLDADAMVVDFSWDMRRTVPEPWCWFACCKHATPDQMDIVHFHTGMMYFRICPGSVAFLQEIMDRRFEDLGEGWHEQSVINQMLYENDGTWQRGFRELTYRWNANQHDNTPRHDTIVAAWHGACHPPERRTRMRQYAIAHPYSPQSPEHYQLNTPPVSVDVLCPGWRAGEIFGTMDVSGDKPRNTARRF